MNDFFLRQAQPINMSEVNWDILGLSEVASKESGTVFKVHKVLAISDIMKEMEGQRNLEIFSYTIMNLKIAKLHEAVEDIKEQVIKQFSKEISSFEDTDVVVQLVKVPLSFLDFAPGDTSINFEVFTERKLGILKEEGVE